MKKLLLLTTASLLLTTTYAAAGWVSPLPKACTQNGGKLTAGGVCEATWHDAGRICSAAGGRLPSIDELKQVVAECGGVIGDDINGLGDNVNISAYQSCYQNKGFSASASGFYWSSEGAWIVRFYDGYADVSPKTYEGYVRCVGSRQ